MNANKKTLPIKKLEKPAADPHIRYADARIINMFSSIVSYTFSFHQFKIILTVVLRMNVVGYV
jgi:hypothetical protein